MKVWLYDEYNWPSGTCRDRVPSENPSDKLTFFGMEKNATTIRLAKKIDTNFKELMG